MESHNLFNYATSELSQDAFICWLMSFADDKKADQNIFKVSNLVLQKLFNLHGINNYNFLDNIEIKKQFEKIDVLLIITIRNEKYTIIIEDKTHTRNHSNQLERYRDAVLKNGFDKQRVLGIYFKTEDQSNYDSVVKSGYKPFKRNDFLDILRKGINLGIKNNIYLDYVAYLESIEQKYNSFNEIPVYEKWNWRGWCGFFDETKNIKGTGNWGYVSNPRGGFIGYWWHWSEWKNNFRTYLQLEESKLCFKLNVKSEFKSKSSKIGRKLYKIISNINSSVKRPNRISQGITVTFGYITEYRVENKNKTIDINRTLTLLKEAEDSIIQALDQV